VTLKRFALVTGGGTAGHTVPALAVARAIAAKHSPDAVEMIGSRRGLDADLLADAEIPVTLLKGRGIRRSTSAKATASNLAALGELLDAFVTSLLLVLRRRPAVVVAVGGYASVAPTIAAALCGVPVIVLNVDAVPGAANRLLSRFAKACAVAYPGTELRRAVVTGPPVRPQILEMHERPGARQWARQRLGLSASARVIACVGGSLGASSINEAMLGLADVWSERDDVAVYHVVGRRDAAWTKTVAKELSLCARTEGQKGLSYVQVPFEERMELVYAAADVAVCRAGANTVAELTVTGTPSLLVPLPGAPGDHQSANADVLRRNGAAVVVKDRDLDAERLSKELDALLGDSGRLARMARAADHLGRPDAAERIADLAERHARRSRKAA
jgi:UDP-N-acetylglucosamine--N-acetylmuramyl-(pentapeptide) pyrophosphoryl-undecaprenol N-acetylglucosamine transferase